jgi:hypothetical protein
MSEFIMPQEYFESIDTTSGDVNRTVQAVVGKPYVFANVGTSGNDVIVTYGSDTYNIIDGTSVKFLYDSGSNWIIIPFESSGIKDGSVALNPRSRVAGRYDSDEVEASEECDTNGYYTIAECKANLGNSIQMARFKITARNSGLDVLVKYYSSTSGILSDDNSSIKILDRSVGSNPGINNARLIVSNSVASAGAKLQVQYSKVDQDQKLDTMMLGNISRLGSSSWELVDPYYDNDSPTCPDGSAGTPIVAGAIQDYNTGGLTIAYPDFMAFVQSSSELRCSCIWREIPKIGSGININWPSSSLNVFGSGSQVALSETDISISNFYQNGKIIHFSIIDTTNSPFGVFTTGYPLFFRWSTSNGYLEITD